MELIFNITEADTESVDIERRGAATIPEPPHEQSSEMVAAPQTLERQEMGRMAEPTRPGSGQQGEIPTVAPPKEYRPTGTTESMISESTVVSPPAHFRR